MASRSPANASSTIGVGNVNIKSPMRDSDLTEFDEGLPKSPMRERFLNDLGSVPNSPVREGNPSGLPLMERGLDDTDFDGVGKSPSRSRNVSKSPVRGSGSRIRMSMRSKAVSSSPMRERVSGDLDGVGESPTRSMNGYIPRLLLRRDVSSESDKNAEEEQERRGADRFGAEEGARGQNMTPKASFNAWLPDDKHAAQPDYNNSGRSRRTWRDRVVHMADHISEEKESSYTDDHGITSEGSVVDPLHRIDPSWEMMRRDLRFKGDYAVAYAKSRESIYGYGHYVGNDGVGVIHGKPKLEVEHDRISTLSSSADGPSNYHRNPIHGYGRPGHNSEILTGPASIQELELERAELLRKYRELKDQLNGFDGKRTVSPGFYRGPDDYAEDEFFRLRHRSMQQLALDKKVPTLPYVSRHSGPVHNAADMYNFHPPSYIDPFSVQTDRSTRPKQPHQFVKHSIASYIPGQSLDFNQHPLESYIDDTPYHHPTCSCSLCYINNRQGQDLPNTLAHRMSGNLEANTRSSYSMYLKGYGSRAYNPRMAQATSGEQPSRLAHRYSNRVVPANLNKKIAFPISGGAPFVLCCTCFQLLKLPKKLIARQKNQHQLQCGACSAVMSFGLKNRCFGPFPSQEKVDYVDAASHLGEVLNESGPKHRRDSFAATSTNVGSYDFDAVGYNIQSLDSKGGELSNGQRSSSSLVKNTRGLSPSSSRSSKEEHISDSASVRRSQPNSAELPVKINLVRPPPGSPLRDHLDYSTTFSKSEAGNITTHTAEEKRVLRKDTSLESSMENTAVTTEMDFISNEVLTASLSQDSVDVSGEEDKDGNSKDRQTSIAAFIKGAFVPRPGPVSPGTAEVYVNGQPIPHRVVKRAEKLAGHIQPGDYWYDSKAGFWGVMGHHCLGIIPPFIQEFSFPLSVNCSDGDTAVYVNGRELHKRDLDLLSSRGLPSAKNKSYIIDISGKVLDEETKEFVVNLGKLAPTVERRKHGFGMQVPQEPVD